MSETKDMVDLKLTRMQCKNVAEFIEYGLLDEIRRDESIDNLRWVEDMIVAMHALQQASTSGTGRDER